MQFRDLGTQYIKLKPAIDAGIQAVVASGKFISGPQVKELEGELAAYVGRKHCISCANGTDALELVLRAWEIGPGDAVFLPAFTFMSTAEVVALVGATPVFTDICEATFNMDAVSLENAIAKTLSEGKLKPRAIIPVDLFGQPADYDKILPIAEKFGLKVLEDGAQGFGGDVRGKLACSFGDASTTSFFPAKPLGCYGDGGAIFTDDDSVAALIRSFCVHGKGSEKYENVRIGRNSRLDTLQAAILLPKLRAFRDFELDAVNQAASWYTERLADSGLVTPSVLPGFRSSWAQYSVLCVDEEQRNALQAKLKAQGIPSMVYYPRGMHQQEMYRYMNLDDELFPNTIEATDTVLSLPMHPYMDEETVDMICQELKR